MIDFHSHILPGIDDGSENVEESREMLQALAGQKIPRVCATPHFYPESHSLTHFLEKRERACAKLKASLPEDAPEILLGAEVYYYAGISRLDRLDELCLEGTNLLLLEMPMRVWNEYTAREVEDIACRGDVRVVLAHVDRYFSYQRPGVFDRFAEEDILMQFNAAAFLSFLTRRRALRWLDEGYVQFLGSDCHNLTDRKPRMREALDVIREKLGDEFSDYFDSLGDRVIRHSSFS